MKKIGFIGTGVMGQSIVRHLLKKGYEVTIYTRTKSKAEGLLEIGARWANTPKEATRQTDIVFTMVGYPIDVEEVYFGLDGVLAGAHEGQVLVDLTTSSPALAKRIAQHAEVTGAYSLDAPVSGGDIGAQNGTLSIMCGGTESTFRFAKPYLEVFGENIVYQGAPGAGQHTKMANQIAIATNMIGVCEAVYYAVQSGLDPDKVLQSIATGAAGSWSLSNLAPRMLREDFEPGFFVKHFIKDMDIALQEADMMNIELPGLSMARKMYEELAKDGASERGTQVLYRYYRQTE